MPLAVLQQSRSYHGKVQDFMTLVIEPVLSNLTLIPYHTGAPQLLLGTALTESAGLKYRTQLKGGPARGLFQMEGATHDDIWENYLKYNPAIARQVAKMTFAGKKGTAQEMVYNDNYAAAMCRVHYYRTAKTLLGGFDKISEHANVWKKYYNTPLGAGTVSKYLKDWDTYGGDQVKARMYCPQ